MNIPYPLPTRKPYSGDQVKELFTAAGVPISSWAEANGFTPRQVYMVINGQFKGRRGISHDISMRLGMKLPVAQIAA